MNQAPQALKDAKLQRYYDALFAMHGSEGWQELMLDMEFMETEHSKIDAVNNGDELQFRKGQLDMIRWLKTHKERTEAAYAHIIEEDVGEGAVPDATGGKATIIDPMS